jgi:hypothetical protein
MDRWAGDMDSGQPLRGFRNDAELYLSVLDRKAAG